MAADNHESAVVHTTMDLRTTHQFRPGEVLEVPVTMQVLAAIGEQDRIFYVCAAADNFKRNLSLRESVFVICTEPQADADLLDIPESIVKRADAIVDKMISEVTEQPPDSETEFRDDDDSRDPNDPDNR